MPNISPATEALIKAANFGDLDDARAALAQGADINGGPAIVGGAKEAWAAQRFAQRWPLLGAVTGCHEAMVELLLTHKPNLEIPGGGHKWAWTEEKVVRAILVSNGGILRRLLEAGLDPNLQDPAGRTFLHQAIEDGISPVITAQIVRLLLEYHADWRLKAKDGRTAEELAAMYLRTVTNPPTKSYQLRSVTRGNVLMSEAVLPILRAAREQGILQDVVENEGEEKGKPSETIPRRPRTL